MFSQQLIILSLLIVLISIDNHVPVAIHDCDLGLIAMLISGRPELRGRVDIACILKLHVFLVRCLVFRRCGAVLHLGVICRIFSCNFKFFFNKFIYVGFTCFIDCLVLFYTQFVLESYTHWSFLVFKERKRMPITMRSSHHFLELILALKVAHRRLTQHRSC